MGQGRVAAFQRRVAGGQSSTDDGQIGQGGRGHAAGAWYAEEVALGTVGILLLEVIARNVPPGGRQYLDQSRLHAPARLVSSNRHLSAGSAGPFFCGLERSFIGKVALCDFGKLWPFFWGFARKSASRARAQVRVRNQTSRR